MKLRVLAGGMSGVLALAGCSSQFMPPRDPHITTIVQGGMLTYVRDGRKFPHGLSGSGLVSAVSGDPEARQAAETYYHHNVTGFVLNGVGLFGVVGGSATFVAERPANSNRLNAGQAVAITAMVAGLACTITGLVLIATGQPYQFDAVNIYNTHVDEKLRGYAPPGYAPRPGYPLPPRYSLPPGYVPPAGSARPPAPRSAPAKAPSAAPASSAAPATSAAPAMSAAPRGSSAPLPPPPPAPTGQEE